MVDCPVDLIVDCVVDVVVECVIDLVVGSLVDVVGTAWKENRTDQYSRGSKRATFLFNSKIYFTL